MSPFVLFPLVGRMNRGYLSIHENIGNKALTMILANQKCTRTKNARIYFGCLIFSRRITSMIRDERSVDAARIMEVDAFIFKLHIIMRMRRC